MKKIGHNPTLLTAKNVAEIEERLRTGIPRAHAAESIGIHRDTLYWWLQMGREAAACDEADCRDDHHGPRDGDINYLSFLGSVTKAEAQAVGIATTYIAAAMAKDWRAALAWLERRHPADYKLVERRELTGPDGGAITVQSPADAITAEADKIAKRLLSTVEGSKPPIGA